MSFSNCRKKSDTASKEVMEAGYPMTAEGWFSAVSSNDVAVLRKMVAGGFDKKTKDAAGNGALHVAAAFGAKEASEYLAQPRVFYRPGQIVIEETANGEVRTLRLRGPRG